MDATSDLMKSKQAKLFSLFLKGRKVLVVDANPSACSSIIHVLMELSVQPGQIVSAETYAQAEKTIREIKPVLVITEYDLGKQCGLELFRSQREYSATQAPDSIFVIVTGNSSQVAAARSLEEAIDAYIIKPYTVDYIRKTLLQTVIDRLRPPDYLQTLSHGKEALERGDLETARRDFEEAMTLDPSPALACYYLSQVFLAQKKYDDAETALKKGLALNKIHYKCLVGLYELCAIRKRHEEAYELVKRLSKHFPASPKRLADVIRLAILTGNYQDIERYFLLFLNLDQKNELLARYTYAGLIVCGKHYLNSKVGASRAIELFDKAAKMMNNRPKVLAEIIGSLLEFGMQKEARSFLARFEQDDFGTDEYLLCRFLVHNATSGSSLAVEQGYSLINKGIADIRLYEAVVDRLISLGRIQSARDLIGQGLTALPNEATRLRVLLGKIPSES
jgi:tetratricopeptide (TPR) repeat protein